MPEVAAETTQSQGTKKTINYLAVQEMTISIQVMEMIMSTPEMATISSWAVMARAMTFTWGEPESTQSNIHPL